MTDKTKFPERLKAAMEVRGMKANDLARLTGIDKAAISNYRSGAYVPKTDKLLLISETLRVNEAWLMGSDEVPMDRKRIATDTVLSLSDDEVMLIEQYRKGDDDKKRFMMYAATLHKK